MTKRTFMALAFILAVTFMMTPGIAHAAPAKRGGKIHIVKRGETLSGIAARYGVSVRDLVRVNRIRNRNRIYVGQRLIIPKRGRKQGSKNKSPAANQQPVAGNGKKWIEVDLSRQMLYAHQGNKVVLRTRITSGLPRTPTPVGRYRVRLKIRRQTMSGPGYRLPNVQWVMYFVGDYAIHGTYWHNNFGRPMSHGCVNATNKAARFLYNWAPRGTPVVIHR